MEKEKKPGAYAYEEVQPEVISLNAVLKELKLSQDQLIVLGILVGTDYNIGGIKGIGPKKALKLINDCGNDFEKIFSEAKWDDFFDFPWKNVFDLIKNMNVTDKYELKWSALDKDKVIKVLVEEHDFSKERVEKSLERLEKSSDKQQKSLSDF